MKVNIVRPSGQDSGIFNEWAELLSMSLIEIVYEASISFSQTKVNHLNIVIGIFYPNDFLDSLAEDTIIINT